MTWKVLRKLVFLYLNLKKVVTILDNDLLEFLVSNYLTTILSVSKVSLSFIFTK